MQLFNFLIVMIECALNYLSESLPVQLFTGVLIFCLLVHLHKIIKQFIYGQYLYKHPIGDDDFIVTIDNVPTKSYEPDFPKLATPSTQLRLSGTPDYEVWKTKINALLCLNNVVIEKKSGRDAENTDIQVSAVDKVSIFITYVASITGQSATYLGIT